MRVPIFLAACLSFVACSDPIPDYGVGPFRGALLDVGTLDPLPVRPAELEADVEIAAVPKPTIDPEEPEEVVIEAEPEPIVEPEAEAEAAPAIEPAEVAVPTEIAPDEEVLQLNFDDMADFEYTPPTLDEIDEGTVRPNQIPDSVLAFNNKVVEIEGYMIPIEVEQGKVQSFILSRTLSGCCFGDMPNIQEWVDVKMQEDRDADYIPYAPVLVIGRISVGEVVDEYGITSLYRMIAESVEDPW